MLARDGKYGASIVANGRDGLRKSVDYEPFNRIRRDHPISRCLRFLQCPCARLRHEGRTLNALLQLLTELHSVERGANKPSERKTTPVYMFDRLEIPLSHRMPWVH